MRLAATDKPAGGAGAASPAAARAAAKAQSGQRSTAAEAAWARQYSSGTMRQERGPGEHQEAPQQTHADPAWVAPHPRQEEKDQVLVADEAAAASQAPTGATMLPTWSRYGTPDRDVTRRARHWRGTRQNARQSRQDVA